MSYFFALMIAASPWTCDAALTALFTPPHPQVGQYEVCTTVEGLDDVVATGMGEPLHFADVEALSPLDALGAAGPYDRAAVARLYGGRRVRVARGWARRGEQFVSVTLISPYPDNTLTRLQPGTMAIRLTVPSFRPRLIIDHR